MNKDYSKREVDKMFENQEDHFKYIREKLENIEDQTIRTNGRVDELENWKSKMNGAVAVIITVLMPIIFIVIQSIIS